MTVGELIELLKTFPSDRRVIIKRDTDQPGYGPIREVAEGIVVYNSYGNDFLKDAGVIMSTDEARAVCIEAHEDLMEDAFEIIQ